MSRTDSLSLPVIDFAPFRQGPPDARQRVAAELGAACRDSGFFYLAGHGIVPEAVEALHAAAKAYFAQSIETKLKDYIGHSPCHRGYVPQGEEQFYGGTVDAKEAFDLALDLPPDDPDYLAGNPMLGPNVWPDLPGFRESVGHYHSSALALGRKLLQAFALALDLDEHFFDRFVTKPTSQLRLIHYPANSDAPPDAPGIGAHTDYELFTILLPTSPGLEVMNGAGQWVDAPPVPGTFVVNIGDMMETWTNGRFVATSHRVRRVSEERYSFPLFFACDYHTTVAPLHEVMIPGERPRYPSIVAGDHLLAQSAQTFRYLKRRIAAGELELPEQALGLQSFGREARHAP